MLNSEISIDIAGENALIVYLGDSANDETAELVHQAEKLIRIKLSDDFIDLIPSYASILVMFDMNKCDHHQLRKKLRLLLADLRINNVKEGDIIELPVYYSKESGPDLVGIANAAQLSVEEVISIHQAQTYRVYAIGFAPGFAYLGEVDERIAMPRLATPRMKVPKGAVAIADRQTAVYPSVSPGGWNIIGLCPIDMFTLNPCVENASTMPVKVGDRVTFRAISKNEFITLGGHLPDHLGK